MHRWIACVSSLWLVALVAACTTGATGTTSPPTAMPTTAATLISSVDPGPSSSPGFPSLLMATGEAGTYQLMAKSPPIRLTVADGWSLYFDEPGGTYMNLGGAEFLVGRNDQVIDPVTTRPAPIPEDLMGWFVEHPDLNASKPKPIEISGLAASYVDINPTRSVDVFYDPLGNFHVGPGPMARFYAVPLEGPDLFIAVLRAESGELDEALAVGIPVVESLEILD